MPKKTVVGGEPTETDLKVKAAIGEELFRNCTGYEIHRKIGEPAMLVVWLLLDVDEEKGE
jgi:hypothetical protein